MPENTEILPGTLDLLVLRALELGAAHGLGVSDRIRESTGGVFVVKPGSLFPALHRLEQNGWIAGEWGESEANRRARYYKLTNPGRRHLESEKKAWERKYRAVNRLLGSET